MRSGIHSFREWRVVATFVSALFCLSYLLIFVPAANAQGAVCAEVRIEIRQKVSIERQAFDAVLRIRNGLTLAAVENVSVDVLFSDADGNAVLASSDPNNTEAKFFIRLDALDGIDALDGTGSVAPQSTGTIRWIIIPAASAGGTTPVGVMYMVGARLQYRLNDEDKVVDVVPEAITVKPQPRLKLDYFLAGDVYADDAFTPEIEPAVPFTLGVRLSNTGAGVGHNVSIESAQPEIVDNEQGLLVGFKITGSHVDEQPSEPSLKINFGDIPAGGVRMGRWLMETTLSGRFVSMDASYTHADALGGALTSLMDGQPSTHLLVHDVMVELPGRDGVHDFLARDGDVLRVYESTGIDSEVVDFSEEATLSTEVAGQRYALEFPQLTGFSYVRVEDPSHGQASGLTVMRSSGELVSTANAWYSKTRKPDLSWSYYLNVFEANGGGTYTVLVDVPPASGSLSGEVYVDLNGNGAHDTDEGGLDAVELSLSGTVQGGGVHRTVATQDGGKFTFAGLPQGNYTLTVADVANFNNGAHAAGAAGGLIDPTSISQITLGNGVTANGYRFAKVPDAADAQADLQALSVEGPARVSQGTPTTLTFRVQNVGPQAALARSSVQLPAAFSVTDATASGGSFDADGGIWSHGSLLPGQQQSLSVQGTFTQVGAQVVGASVQLLDEGMVDPDDCNNSQVLGIQVEAASILSVVNQAAPISDLLFWVSCAEGAANDCAASRLQRWQTLLDSSPIRHRIVTDPAEFADALRSGEWRSVWLDGGNGLGEGTLAAEIRESVRRGGALIVSGARNAGWQRFEALTGASFSSDLPADTRTVALLPSEYFEAGGLAATGQVAMYEGGSGRILAEYAPGMAAIVATPVDAPAPVVIFGFDPLPGIEVRSDPQLFISEMAIGAAVRMPGIVLGNSVLPFRVRAERPNANSSALDLAVNYPESFTLLSTDPAPTLFSAGSLSWAVNWPLPQASFEAAYTLRAPAGDGNHTILALAQWEGEEAEASTPIETRSRLGQVEKTDTALTHLDVTATGEQAMKQAAQEHFAAGVAAYQQGDQQAAITELLAAIAIVDAMQAVGASDVALELSRTLLALSRDQPTGPSSLLSDGFEDGL